VPTRGFGPLRKVGDYAKAKVSGLPLTVDEEFMATTTATKKTAVKPAAKKAATPAVKKPKTTLVKKAAAPVTKKPVAAAPLKPIKDSFTKASLAIHLAERAGVEPKAAKALMAALEETVPAKKKRFGKDPFSGQDKWFAAKPATVRLKVRPLKKLKEAAL
jgi:hypothetical protein